MRIRRLLPWVLGGAILVTGLAHAAEIGSPDFAAADLFKTPKVWTAHLTVSPDQWLAMQPMLYNRQERLGTTGEKALRNGSVAMGGVDFAYVHGDLEFEGQKLPDVGVRYKGNFSFALARPVRMGMPNGSAEGGSSPDAFRFATSKPSYKIQFNQYVKGQKVGGIATLNFQNNVADPSWMNEVLAYRLYRDAGVPAPRTAYAKLYLTIPGKVEKYYLGLYSLSEDVDKTFTGDRFGTAKGALIKPYDKVNLFGWRGADWKAYVQIFDPKSTFTPEQKARYMAFCDLVSNADDARFVRELPDYLDIEEFARFMAVTVWLSDSDNLMDNGHNFYAFLDPRTDKLLFIPWDQDHAFGHYEMRLDQHGMESRSILQPWTGTNRFLQRIFGVEAFRNAYLERITEFVPRLFQPERLAEQVDDLAIAIRPAVEEESQKKRELFDKFIAGDVAGAGTDPIKKFAVARTASVTAQLAEIGK